jgi:hypothetical protein
VQASGIEGYLNGVAEAPANHIHLRQRTFPQASPTCRNHFVPFRLTIPSQVSLPTARMLLSCAQGDPAHKRVSPTSAPTIYGASFQPRILIPVFTLVSCTLSLPNGVGTRPCSPIAALYYWGSVVNYFNLPQLNVCLIVCWQLFCTEARLRR